VYLGIEIGGTKLQLGVSAADGSDWAGFLRYDIDARRGASGILEQIAQGAGELSRRFPVTCIGVGFGGPVDAVAGRVIKSHQVDGWDGFPLAAWLTERLHVPVRLGNDCDVAALAEATYGAGRGKNPVFFVTVGTGVGGGLVIGGRVHGAGRPAVAEIGHLRPGLGAEPSCCTVESIASGLGLAAAAKAAVRGDPAPGWAAAWSGVPDTNDQPVFPWRAVAERWKSDLVQRAGGDAGQITGRLVADAAAMGNPLAQQILTGACRTLGWAIAQLIALVAPEVVVVGGGVSLIGEEWFFAPLRRAVERYVFPPLARSYVVVPAALGEAVVVHGAVALAAAPSV
jgi:glucokinase